MRHLAIACWYLGGPGSVERLTFRLGRELAARYRVTFVSQRLPEPAPWASFHPVPTPDLRPFGVFRQTLRKAHFGLRCAMALEAIHQREPLDFVLAEGAPTAALGALTFRNWTRVPFAYHVHGDLYERPKGTLDPVETLFQKRMQVRAERNADLVLPGAAQFAALSIGRGAEPSRVRLLPNAIDPEEIGAGAPCDPARRDGPLRILVIARLAVEKDLPTFLEACSRLPFDYRADLYGAGPLEAELRRRIESARLEGRVRLCGTVPRREIGPLCRGHDVLVLPSRSEVFPVTILDALAAGLPVIATDVGGNAVMVADGENGLVVPPSDPESLAAAIARIERDEELRLRMAARARPSVLPRYSWRAMADTLAGYVEETLAARGARTRLPVTRPFATS